MAEDQRDAQEQRQFALQRVYTKDISFETPNSPAVFQKEWKPQSSLNLGTEVRPLNDGVWEVVLSLTVTTKLEDQTAYLAEVKQAAVVAARGFSEPELGPLLGAFAPNQLFPYAREVVSDLVAKGSFPQLVLAPVNFDAIYAQHQQQLAEKAKAEGATVQ
jgi:preprotein translocase subunit SecB